MNGTKAASYEIVKKDRATKSQIICEMIQIKPGITRAQIAVETGYRLSSVCGRVNELIAAGKVKVQGYGYDLETRRFVEVLIPAGKWWGL